MGMKNLLVRTAVLGALGVATMAGFMAPASASQAPALHLASVAAAVTRPNTDIKGSPGHWVPNKLRAPVSKATSCTRKNHSFSITNTTGKGKVVHYKIGSQKRKLLGTLAAHTKYLICDPAPKGTKTKLYIKGSSSVLTDTAT